jgi:hypothetical protein
MKARNLMTSLETVSRHIEKRSTMDLVDGNQPKTI